MKTRWICLYVENEVGSLSKIATLFSGKTYNLNSLTVGTTETASISRMTISLSSDDKTFEQVKKQLNRSIEVIKVIDFTDVAVHCKELMFVTIKGCNTQDIEELFRMARVYDANVIDYHAKCMIMECVHTKEDNDVFMQLLQNRFAGRVQIVRGGSVAVEALIGKLTGQNDDLQKVRY